MERVLASLTVLGVVVGVLATASPPSGGQAVEPACADVAPVSVGRTGARPCTHGPDERPPIGAATPRARVASPAVQCYGDGVSGPRVQAVYARAEDVPDRFAQVEGQIRLHAAQVEAEVAASAAQTGGERHVRWVTTPGPACQLDILRVTLGTAGDEDFPFDTIPQLVNLGLDDIGRAYLIWMEPDPADPTAICGIGSFYADDRPGPQNANFYGPSWSRIDPHCWGSAETHELGHNLGAVQPSAPNANGAGHCRDDWDLMCYDDGIGAPRYPTPFRCLDFAQERRWDCGKDDYFHTSPPAGSYLATHWNIADSPFLARTASVGTEGAGAYHPVSPGRVYDGRTPGVGRVPALGSHLVQVTGRFGIPAAGVAAVQLNVTVTEPLADGFVSLYSADDPGRPNVSNLNFPAGATVANSVLVTVPRDGYIRVFASSGDPFVVIDVAGWYADASGYQAQRGGYHPVTPFRLHDTRLAPPSLGPGASIRVPVRGRGPLPPSGPSAAVLNVTAVGATQPTFLTVHPSGELRPLASNINAPPGPAVPNQVVAKLGADGALEVFNAAGTVDVVIDVLGWFDDGTGGAPAGSVYHAVAPHRVYDSRFGPGPLRAGEDRLVHLGAGGVPAQATAVVANITVASPTTGGYVNAYPWGAARPYTSLVNFEAGQTVPNLVTLPVAANAHAWFYNPVGETHLVVDVTGWYGPAP